MKNILFFLALCIGHYASAQSSLAVNYQAIAKDGSGNLIASQLVGVRVSILSGSILGSVVYSETHEVTTNINGLFHIEIGRGTVVSGDFANIGWHTGSHFAKIDIDANGGSNYQHVGTSQFLSTPYSLFAEKLAMQYSLKGFGYYKEYNRFNRAFNPSNIPTQQINVKYLAGEYEELDFELEGLNSFITTTTTVSNKINFSNSSEGKGYVMSIDKRSIPGVYAFVTTTTNPRGVQKTITDTIEILECPVTLTSLSDVYYGHNAGNQWSGNRRVRLEVVSVNELTNKIELKLMGSAPFEVDWDYDRFSGSFTGIDIFQLDGTTLVIGNASGTIQGIFSNQNCSQATTDIAYFDFRIASGQSMVTVIPIPIRYDSSFNNGVILKVE